MTRRLLPYGESALLVECADLDDALGLQAWLVAERPAAVGEVVPGARTLLLRLTAAPGPALRAELLTRTADRDGRGGGDVVEIPVRYDGEDLLEVARLTGLDPDEVVAVHTGQTWTVAFCGFAPGFGYLQGSDNRLRVPRRASPRPRVPAGSVGLADHWSGVYPRVGPGGWQLIGRTDAALFDLRRDPPARLRPGGRVRFRDVSC